MNNTIAVILFVFLLVISAGLVAAEEEPGIEWDSSIEEQIIAADAPSDVLVFPEDNQFDEDDEFERPGEPGKLPIRFEHSSLIR